MLSFARTLAHDQKILILDEATANIDTETEQWIQEALERLMQDKPLKRPGGKDRKEPPIMAVYAAPVIKEEK